MEGPQARLWVDEESLKERSQEVGEGPREAQWTSRMFPEVRRVRSVGGRSWLWYVSYHSFYQCIFFRRHAACETIESAYEIIGSFVGAWREAMEHSRGGRWAFVETYYRSPS